LAQDGRGNEFVPLDTSSLTAPAYHHFLHDRFPQKWPDMVPLTYTNALNPIGLVQLLTFLSRSNDLYYLHPSFGYYFEQFYLEPHGLVYKMKSLPKDTLLPPHPDLNLIAENEKFWTHDAASSLARVAGIIAPPDPNAPLSVGEDILMRLHISRQANQTTATEIGLYYSRSLDFWGTELERAGQLDRAGTNFEAALDLNPDNAIAKINLAFNKKLRTGAPVTLDPSQVTTDQFGKYATWVDVLNADGPFDDPNYCFVYGLGLFQDKNVRQSIDQFERVRELAPDFYPARYQLAEAYLLDRLPKPAMEALREPLQNPRRFSLSDNDESKLHFLVAAVDFQQADSENGMKLIDAEIARHPHDNTILTSATQIFMVRGLFTNALDVINDGLKSDPTNSSWLYYKGYVSIQLKNYSAAITALDEVLKVQTNNGNALFNRAIANLNSGNLEAAKADYLRLQQSVTNAPAISYGLGEIAWRKHDTNEAIRNYQLYLAHANTNSAEAKTIVERLKSLKP
jgi:tetratricopeptide (TPR) repeat protein